VGHAREQVTDLLMKSSSTDRRDLATGKDAKLGRTKDAPAKPKYLNPVFLMTDSGARGSVDQIRSWPACAALMAKPSGEIIETPIKSNFREGLSVLEYFSSTHGARKGLADTALKTADSGYLTRKLADVAQNVIVNETTAARSTACTKRAIYKGEEVDIPLREHASSAAPACPRSIRNPITDQRDRGEKNQIINDAIAREIEELGLDKIRVRSPLTCESRGRVRQVLRHGHVHGPCIVEEGLAVGIIAAQSIGEPGTQLTMRTFHTGGVAVSAKSWKTSTAARRTPARVSLPRLNPVLVLPMSDGSSGSSC
jgi:DNA-directed RNA polymerase subunit beta'